MGVSLQISDGNHTDSHIFVFEDIHRLFDSKSTAIFMNAQILNPQTCTECSQLFASNLYIISVPVDFSASRLHQNDAYLYIGVGR